MTDQMHDALATWHMGRVIYAYRTHPYHGNLLAQELVASWLGLSQSQLSRLEVGTAPEQLSKLIHWAETLEVPGELLWFKLPKRNVDALDDVNRHGFLRAAAAVTLAPGTLLELIADLRSTPVPATVGQEDIEEIRTAARQISSWDAGNGRGLVREAVLAQLRYAVRLLDANATPRDKAELRSAVGFLSHTAGFMAFDRYDHEDARAMFDLALGCAEECRDWNLRAKVLSSMARQSIWTGDLDNGLKSVRMAFERSDRLTATERAMLHTTKARALAKQGRVQDTLLEIGRAHRVRARRCLVGELRGCGWCSGRGPLPQRLDLAADPAQDVSDRCDRGPRRQPGLRRECPRDGGAADLSPDPDRPQTQLRVFAA
ncbi:hypothetical protein AB0N05_27625 [Nocardia sp. NPDC051030]|uniref:hypothetical protein n=1 Tax=Nocardia sp. NPDC051030 TaxID=3155162 RepID=UPI00344941C2